MPNSGRGSPPREERGEGASDELMARAEALPGSFTVEIRDGKIVYVEVDASGRARQAVRSAGDGGPLVWEDVEPSGSRSR